MKPLVRSASLSNYADLARSGGLDPIAMVKEVGIDPACLEQQDFRIPISDVGRLLENSASRTGWSDFGLRLAELRQYSVSGPLALLAREQADLREAIAVHTRYIHLHNESLHVWLEEDPLTASLRFEHQGLEGPTRQVMELTIGMAHRWFQQSLPEGWRSRLVCFMHAPPPDQRTAMRMFFNQVEYSADFNGIVCSTKDLNSPLASYPQLERYARQYVESIASSTSRSMAQKVRQLALTMLPLGAPTLSKVASNLGLDERSVRRHLAKEGTGFNEVLNELRCELVRRYLSMATRKQAEVAFLLGFTSASVFARWFREQFGCTAVEWAQRGEQREVAGARLKD